MHLGSVAILQKSDPTGLPGASAAQTSRSLGVRGNTLRKRVKEFAPIRYMSFPAMIR